MVSGSKGATRARNSRPARLPRQKEYKKGQCTGEKAQGSLTHEEELTGLEEERQAALEMAQEEDEKAEESSEAAQEVDALVSIQGGMG